MTSWHFGLFNEATYSKNAKKPDSDSVNNIRILTILSKIRRSFRKKLNILSILIFYPFLTTYLFQWPCKCPNRIRIGDWLAPRIRVHTSGLRIRGSGAGSLRNMYGSRTLLKTIAAASAASNFNEAFGSCNPAHQFVWNHSFPTKILILFLWWYVQWPRWSLSGSV